MGLDAIRLTGTTDTNGDAVINAEYPVLALLYAVEWIDGDLADGVDAVLKSVNNPSAVDTTLLTLTDANADAWYFPRETEDDTTGVAATNKVPAVITGKLQLTISSGGDTKTGGAIVYIIS